MHEPKASALRTRERYRTVQVHTISKILKISPLPLNEPNGPNEPYVNKIRGKWHSGK